ncbi:hypothetical protein ACVWZX_004411 [Deinococcus sp. UYEF24]
MVLQADGTNRDERCQLSRQGFRTSEQIRLEVHASCLRQEVSLLLRFYALADCGQTVRGGERHSAIRLL